MGRFGFQRNPRDEAKKLLREFPVKPTFIVASGGGWHYYWKLKEPSGKEDIPRVEAVMRGLVKALKGDPSATDASRILRVPGTLNRKYDPPAQVRVVKSSPDRTYNLSDFDLYADDSPVAKAAPSVGDSIPATKRNHTLTSLAGSMRRRGFSIQAIEAALLEENKAKCAPPLPEDEVRAIAASVGRYEPAPQVATTIEALGPNWTQTPSEHTVPEDPQQDSLEFPYGVITGAAGRFTWIYEGIVESPPQFTYMAYLTCLGAIASGSLTLKTHLKTQPRLFTIMLAKSGSGRKSSGNQNVTDFFKTVYDKFGWCGGVGSAEGLQKNLMNKPKLLLDFDEMKVFVSKCAADSSVLLPCVNTLFEKNVYENHTKKESVRLEGVHLSFLAASTLATYSNAWSSSFTDIGFNNRLFLVTGDSERKYSIPRVIDGKVHYELRRDLEKVIAFIQENPVLDVTPEAFERYDYWYKHPAKSEHVTRLDAYALRLMLLLAVNDMKPIVDLETVEKVIKLCDHQLLVRKAHDPVDADNQIAVLEEKIRRNLAARGTLVPRELKKYTNANRTGIQLFQKAIANLLAENEISQDKDLRYALKDFSQ